jgi:hypothetical protein
MAWGFDGLSSKAGRLADLENVSFGLLVGCGEWRTILYIGTEPYENATVPRIMLRV